MDQTLQGPTGAAPPDWRGLCEELIALVECCPVTTDTDWITKRNDLIVRVHGARRPALAQPEPEVVGLSDEELLPAEPPNIPTTMAMQYRSAWREGVEDGWNEARAFLARHGRLAPAGAGADGELVAWLAGLAVRAADCGQPKAAGMLTWAAQVVGEHADPVDRQAAPVPVPVSEKPLAQEAYIAFVQICKGNSDGAGTYEDDEKLVRSAIKRLAELEVSPPRHPAPVPPVEGEVGELVAWLRDRAESTSLAYAARRITRAADLLEQRQPAPVPVSERMPGVEDCDAEGRCWWWDGEWGLVEQRFTDYHATHWLPATALPLPSGEVE